MERGHIYHAPERILSWYNTVFLAGTIDMGNSYDWQAEVSEILADHGLDVLNPRRKDWDSSWEQMPSNPKLRQQVDWELDGIKNCKNVIFNFLPNSKSPVTMAEVGYLLAKSPEKAWICCPKTFWKYANVEIMADREGINIFYDMESLTEDFIKYLHK